LKLVAVDAMNRPFQNPNVDSVGAPNFHKRCNFATAGSTKLPANTASPCPFSFGIQVRAKVFFSFSLHVLQ